MWTEYILRLKNGTKNHVIECTCHWCINLKEVGYKKKNNEWSKCTE